MFNSMPNGYDGLDRWSWRDGFDDDGLGSRDGRIAIVGLADAGKRTLCNALWGWDALAEEDDSDEMIRNFGLFHLIDLPSNSYDAENVMFRLESVDLVIYVADGVAGITKDDFAWIARLRSMDAALLVALNKVDQLQSHDLKSTLHDLEARLARPVIPLVAQDQAAVRDHFLPVLLKASPRLAVPLATEIVSLRPTVARQLIRESVLASRINPPSFVAIGENNHLIDLQTTLVKRIAAIYGYQSRPDGLMKLLLSSLTEFAPPLDGLTSGPQSRWGVGDAVAPISTWIIGRVALAYYEANLPTFTQWFTGKNPYDTFQQPGS